MVALTAASIAAARWAIFCRQQRDERSATATKAAAALCLQLCVTALTRHEREPRGTESGRVQLMHRQSAERQPPRRQGPQGSTATGHGASLRPTVTAGLRVEGNTRMHKWVRSRNGVKSEAPLPFGRRTDLNTGADKSQ